MVGLVATVAAVTTVTTMATEQKNLIAPLGLTVSCAAEISACSHMTG